MTEKNNTKYTSEEEEIIKIIEGLIIQDEEEINKLIKLQNQLKIKGIDFKKRIQHIRMGIQEYKNTLKKIQK
jgi:hypothetical protein